MKQLSAIIEKTSDGYNVYTENEMFTGMGDTAEEAKKDMLEQIKFYLATCKDSGASYPAYLESDIEITYKFSVESLLKYYQGILPLATLERITGVNQKQLWSYANGKSKPRLVQVDKIRKGIHAFAQELLSVTL